MLTDQQKERYNRQILLPNFGEAAQEKLLKAKVLVVGAGGLGCPVLQYIVGAGIGNVGIIDADVVSLSNLQRQILYTEAEIGQYKAELAAKKMAALNSDVSFEVYTEFLSEENAKAIIAKYDMVVGATDNFKSRYLIDKYTKELGLPFVHGSIGEYEGQYTVFNYKGSMAYADLFPNSNADGGKVLGVMGALPGVIGSYMGWEVIKIASEVGEVAANKLFIYNGLNNKIHQLKY
ncbi:HesA/MoeB/ThiF family protein [Saccharicrinis aurantiacus]|uniref:HesA/MoeB/ThiF family protein n=1 Tax=Saccharicrinis aurantiacus TaxID=1849719 RepID=UPI0024923BB1|nr:HesA/MoeB/ThiF family protein [Saccharicrinis aurantiacus]